MIWIKNRLIPFDGYKAITIFPFVFYKGSKPTLKTINHENIHGKQQIELLIIPFYIIYLIEAIFKGYKNISFEKEAYRKEQDFDYLKRRKIFAMWRKNNL
jgi:hypothetical protein